MERLTVRTTPSPGRGWVYCYSMDKLFAFGEPVPDEVIKELIEEGKKPEEITTDFIETLYWYEYLDNL